MGTSDSKSNSALWETGFTALCRFRARTGHCCPSRHHVVGKVRLGAWVVTQRYYCSKGRILPERKRRLDTIGLCGLPRIFLGTKLCGAFKIQKAGGTLSRTVAPRGGQAQTRLFGFRRNVEINWTCPPNGRRVYIKSDLCGAGRGVPVQYDGPQGGRERERSRQKVNQQSDHHNRDQDAR